MAMKSFKLSQTSPYVFMGFFFAVAQILILSALAFDSTTRLFLLWSCNNFCILLIIACYRKDMQMLMGISYLGLLSQTVWLLDFAFSLVGFDFTGVTDYIYTEGFTYANNVSIVIHVMVPTVILLFSFKVKPRLRSLLFAIPYLLCLYVVTIFITPVTEDINCVFRACGNDAYLPYNIYVWPLYATVSAVISYGVHYVSYYGSRRLRGAGYCN
jgi:hypothetical protein